MKKWVTWLLYLALLSLLFIAIPISYPGGKSKQQLQTMFNEYIEKFNKSYKNNPDEYEVRFQNFMVSVAEIDRLNAETRGPEKHRAKYGFTKLSDMSKTEYHSLHLSDEKVQKAPHLSARSNQRHQSKGLCVDSNSVHCVYSRRKRASLPLQVDWRAKGVISSVKNQGLCGACWAFSTVGVIEAMAAINSSKLVPLSVQEVIDCAQEGNMGCAGGDICLLLDWLVATNTPLETDSEYPLRLANGMCMIKKAATGVRVKSYTCDDFVGAEDKILETIANHGPVSVAVNGLTWQNYLGGIIQYHCSGAVTDLNHAVELVGYDLSSEIPYYIAKNSWGSEFGLSGYLNLAIGSNVCGLANEVATVDVK